MSLLAKTAFCTIVAKNYLGYARTLVDSLKCQHPESLIFVILADKIDDKFNPDNESFILIESENLGIAYFASFTFKYDVIEFATAIKPYALEFILKNYDVTQLIYLDPDIYVFQKLNYIFSLLNIYSIILIPHITESFPEDGKGMVDQDILLAGIYNLGFIGVKKTNETEFFLKWWQHKLYDKCLMDSSNGMCVDQKWLDFAPVMFKEVYIILESGYNVSYWNLHQQEIQFQSNVWYCNKKLLYFYHFSGFDINKLEEISKYQNRYNLNNRPELRELFEFYRDLLLKNQQNQCYEWNYTYNYFSDGSKIKKQDRKYYYSLGNNRHNINSNPFDKKSYIQWKKKAIFIIIRRKVKIFLSHYQSVLHIIEKLLLFYRKITSR